VSELRWQLQGEIVQLLHYGSNEQLERKKLWYNIVMDTLHELEIGQRIDPIEALPNEIFTSVLLELCRYEIEGQMAKDPLVLFPLMAVSKRWCRFLASAPLLWNYIKLDDERDVIATMKRQLGLSAGVKLTVRFHFPLDQWNLIHPELVLHRDRIESILFSERWPYEDIRENGLWKVIKDLDSLLSLHELQKLIQTDVQKYDPTTFEGPYGGDLGADHVRSTPHPDLKGQSDTFI
jgi:hypothetical protein